MAHVPHLYLGHLDSESAPLTIDQHRHLERVLRYPVGELVQYTDGNGLVGTGRWTGSHVERGEERHVEAPAHRTVAVAPPKPKERQRFIVEKVAELGISELVWLKSRFGQVPPPKAQRTQPWAIAALEQSRRAFLLTVRISSLDDLPTAVVADASGGAPVGDETCIAIGPEGGWHPDEIGERQTVRLSDGVLRSETAAIAAGVLLRPPNVVL